jgi:hypothetical protein
MMDGLSTLTGMGAITMPLAASGTRSRGGRSLPKGSAFLRMAALLILYTALQGTQAAGADDQGPRPASTFTFYQENDIYTGSDRDYTNGIKLSWMSPDLGTYRDDPRLPSWSHDLIGALPFQEGPGLLRTVSLSVGQNIYTPDDIVDGTHDGDDRPYAGITYVSIGFHSRNTSIMDTWEFDLGIVGPHSYAEDTQKLVHELTHSDYPTGWERQLHDEPFLNLFYERKWRLFPGAFGKGMGYDVIPHAGCAVGNAFTAVNGGGQVRLGWQLPSDFGTLPIRPGSDTSAPIDDTDPRCSPETPRFGIHGFASADAYACLLDITLDGNNFRSSDKVDKCPLRAHIAGGIALVAGRFKATYAYVYRTKEYTTQKGRQKYGAITVSYSFE